MLEPAASLLLPQAHHAIETRASCCLPAACGHAAARLADRQPDAAAGGRAWARARVQAAACLRLVLLLLLRLCSLRPVLLPAKLHQRPGQQSRPRGLPDCSTAAETAGRRTSAGSLHCLLRRSRLGLEARCPYSAAHHAAGQAVPHRCAPQPRPATVQQRPPAAG